MDEDRKMSGYAGIWDKANEAREIHFALVLALASAAFADGWEALRPRIASGKQGDSAEAADRKKAVAS